MSEDQKPAKLFPMFLKLSQRPCLVVGAGAIAESKIASLVEAGADVRVIAPEATAQVRSWAEAKKIEWQRREFQAEDLEGRFLVVAATSSRNLHEEIFKEARGRGVLCNIVDVPALCDFYYPAVVQRGALQIAISTSGRSPALAQRLRKKSSKNSLGLSTKSGCNSSAMRATCKMRAIRTQKNASGCVTNKQARNRSRPFAKNEKLQSERSECRADRADQDVLPLLNGYSSFSLCKKKFGGAFGHFFHEETHFRMRRLEVRLNSASH